MISNFFSSLVKNKDVSYVMPDDYYNNLDSVVILTDSKSLDSLKKEESQKIKKTEFSTSTKPNLDKPSKEDMRKKMSTERNMLNFLSGDVSGSEYILGKLGLEEKVKQAKGKLSEKFQNFKDTSGIQKIQDTTNEFREKGLFKFIRDKKIDKRLASESVDNDTKDIKGENIPKEMMDIVSSLPVSIGGNNIQDDLAKVKISGDEKGVDIDDSTISAFLKSNEQTSKALSDIRGILKKIQEGMIDEQDTSIQFGKKKDKDTSTKGKDKKERTKVKDTDNSLGLLDMLALGAAGGAICKRFPGFCKGMSGGLLDFGDKDKKNRKNGKSGRTSSRLGGSLNPLNWGGSDEDDGKRKNKKRSRKVRTSSRFSSCCCDMGTGRDKKKKNKSKVNRKNTKVSTDVNEKSNTKVSTDGNKKSSSYSKQNVNESEGFDKKKPENKKTKSPKPKIRGRGGKLALITAGAYGAYELGSAIFGGSDEDNEKPKSVSTGSVNKQLSSSTLESNSSTQEQNKKYTSSIYDNAIIPKHVNIKGMDDDVLHNFSGMAKEYREKTGKKFKVTSAYRDVEYQQKLFDRKYKEIKKKNPSWSHSQIYSATRKWVAPAGNSMHNWGMALDIDYKSGKQLTEAKKLGLFDKWNFTRPMSHEPWHLEVNGINRKAISLEGKKMMAQGNVDNYNPKVRRMGEETEGLTTGEMVTATAATGALAVGTSKIVKNADLGTKSVKPDDIKQEVVKSEKPNIEKDITDKKTTTKPKPTSSIASKFTKGLGVAGVVYSAYELKNGYDESESDGERKDLMAGFAGSLGGAAAGGMAGAAIGSVVPVFGTAIGGLVGSIAGSIVGEAGMTSLMNRFKDGDDFLHDDLKNKSASEKKIYLINQVLPHLQQINDERSYNKVSEYIKEDLDPKIKKEVASQRKKEIYGTGTKTTPLDKKGDDYKSYDEFSSEFSQLNKEAQQNTQKISVNSNDSTMNEYIKTYNNDVKQKQKNIPEMNVDIKPNQKNPIGSSVITENLMVEKKGSTNSNIQINNNTKKMINDKVIKQDVKQPLVHNTSKGSGQSKHPNAGEYVKLSDYKKNDEVDPLLGYVMSNR